ncbi:hypothetical protein CupriaWKF_34270 [Cupriavidus sp. WKF15]|uniref:hypothetical protein n=1 Tax=Cupriavidus sp. WKF15 TaxID=3032282 RepID=UPI0023E0C8F4|nr:hypothetical protein [Cupriavidus sp. WKF15]WER50576.1 hypothetical protein CupriaWKF_34270 [Cupriavidus sp. WKF15]
MAGVAMTSSSQRTAQRCDAAADDGVIDAEHARGLGRFPARATARNTRKSSQLTWFSFMAGARIVATAFHHGRANLHKQGTAFVFLNRQAVPRLGSSRQSGVIVLSLQNDTPAHEILFEINNLHTTTFPQKALCATC